MANTFGQHVDERDRDNNHQQDGADIGVVELADSDEQILSDAACADKADDRTRPHIDLEPKQRVARQIGQYLGQGGKAHRIDKPTAGAAYAFGRVHVDVFDGLDVELSKGAKTVDADSEHAGERSQTKSADKEQRKDQVR